MSVSGIEVPGSVQRGIKPQAEPQIQPQQAVAALAYDLWLRRGCPQGSSTHDWIEAERQLLGQVPSILSRD